MDVALLTVGDELLAGDIENTNATWLARQLAGRGATVTRILTVPDDVAIIEETVREWSRAFDAVVITGGLGGTHDDVTMDAVAAAFDRETVVEDEVREDVFRTAAAFRDANPEMVDEYDFDLDVDAWSKTAEGSRPLINSDGLSPGCVIGNVYVFPGVPDEMKAMFESIADDFSGDVVSETLYTPAPEGAVTRQLADLRDEFDVAIGSYPTDAGSNNRVKLTGSDPEEVRRAAARLREVIEIDDDVETGGEDRTEGGDE